MRAGHKELDVQIIDGCWADLDSLAAAMRISRKDLGEFDGHKIKCLLEETDLDGRFEVNDKMHVRKLAKENRQRRRPQQVPQFPPDWQSRTQAMRDAGPMEVPSSPSDAGEPRRRSRSNSAETYRSGGNDDAMEDDALAKACASSLRVSGDMEELPTSAEPKLARTGGVPPPSPPPGEHWTQFQDEEGGDFWWFYDGPNGQWWTSMDCKQIQPYAGD